MLHSAKAADTAEGGTEGRFHCNLFIGGPLGINLGVKCNGLFFFLYVKIVQSILAFYMKVALYLG
jgi:hypothetical protein